MLKISVLTLRRFILVTLIALLTLTTPSVSAEKLPAVRLWPTAERTRLVIETAVPVEYKIGGFPSRLILEASIGDGRNIAQFLAGTDVSAVPYLKNFRLSRLQSGDWRFVFELNSEDSDVSQKITRIKPIAGYGNRLVWDIEPKTPPDPLFDLIALLNKREQEATAAEKLQEPFLLVIDPGHGGEDPGAISRKKNQEKKIVLAISKELRDIINSYPGMKAVLTRSSDKFLKLEKRVQIAQRLNADVFVSIHADSVKSPKPSGSSVFVLSEKGATTPLARRLAKQENLSDIIGGDSVRTDPIAVAALKQFSADGKDRASRDLSELLLHHISKINKLHSKRPEAAGFAVLKSSSIPSVLIETAFISNPRDEKKLLDKKFQNKIARSIAQALKEYKDRHHISDK